MKITHIISNKVWGGGEQYVYDLCARLVSDGNKVELLTRPVAAITNKVASLGVPVEAYSFSNLLKVRDGIVHVHNFKDALKAAIAKKITHGNSRIIVTRHLVRPAKTSRLYTWVYANVEKIIFVSELAEREFLSSRPAIDQSKICVVRNSIKDGDTAGVKPLREQLPDGTTILMYHGRIAAEKGLDCLIAALTEIKDIPLHLFLLGTGDAEYTNALQRRIQESGLADSVTLLGFKDNVRPYIHQTDIGIIPTTAREACGLSCMEYMQAGKCLITTNNGGQAEYVTDRETGLLVNPGKPEELAEAIRKAVREKDAIGRKAADYFCQELSYSNFYTKIKSIYEE